MRHAVGIRATFSAVSLVLILASRSPAGGVKTGKLQANPNPHRYRAFSKPLPKQEQLAHVLERLTFGARPGDIATLRKTGLKKWLDEQLNPSTITENVVLDQRLQGVAGLQLDVNEASRRFAGLQDRKAVGSELSEAKILRAVYSNRQLAELLDDFWFNHFNIYLNKGRDRYLVPSYEREVIRPHVLGKFYDLLLSTAESPAMMFYLDNWQSVGGQPPAAQQSRLGKARRGLNENYARELLELHTLGVDGGYTQKDVIEVARCFTGWAIAKPRNGSGFEYNDRVHDKGQKVVLGHVIQANGGMNDGLEVLDILAHYPSTAHFISLKLAQRFVADDPPPALVRRMSKTFLETGGDLRQVMRTMLISREFWSEGAYHSKVKTPFEMVASALRATNAEVTTTYFLEGELRKMGEPLYRKIEPNGYPDTNSEWVSSAALLERMNFGLALAGNRISGVTINARDWRTEEQEPVELARFILQQDPSAQTRAAIENAVSNQRLHEQFPEGEQTTPTEVTRLVAGLALGSPEFQRR